MNEIYEEPNAEELKRQEENEQYEQWMKDRPETIISPEDLRECGPEITKFEMMIESFKLNHDLEKLKAIDFLPAKEAPNHPLREPARKDLKPIVALLNKFIEETNITIEKHKELDGKYMELSRAVGIINENIVYHNRKSKYEKDVTEVDDSDRNR